jgi:hypothetical protein
MRKTTNVTGILRVVSVKSSWIHTSPLFEANVSLGFLIKDSVFQAGIPISS